MFTCSPEEEFECPSLEKLSQGGVNIRSKEPILDPPPVVPVHPRNPPVRKLATSLPYQATNSLVVYKVWVPCISEITAVLVEDNHLAEI